MDCELKATDVGRALAEFSRNDLVRGGIYYEEGRVQELRREACAGDEVRFSATVRGSARAPYEAYLFFESTTGDLLDAECTCRSVATASTARRAFGSSSSVSREARPRPGWTLPDSGPHFRPRASTDPTPIS
jgi:hypothetical protein